MLTNNAKLLHFRKNTHIGKKTQRKIELLKSSVEVESHNGGNYLSILVHIHLLHQCRTNLVATSVTFSPPYIFRHCDDF